MSAVVHELKQLACLIKHKRHFVQRGQPPQEEEYCRWCGVSWIGPFIGELIMYYPPGFHSQSYKGDNLGLLCFNTYDNRLVWGEKVPCEVLFS